MSKKVQKTLTGAMAAMMATGVVATPAMAATNNTDVDALYKAAYQATQKALTEKTQAAVNEARAAIKALPAKLDWAIGEFSKQVDTVQHPILVNIVNAIKKAEAEPTQANINAAKKAIPAELTAQWKNSYSSAVDKIQQGLQTKVVEAVKLAETSKKAEDVEAAKKLIADIATADSQALKDWAKVMLAKVEAIVSYDLTITSIEEITTSSITVNFKAIDEALRNVTLEVIDNNGKAVSVEAKSLLIEGETYARFDFSTVLKEEPTGVWTVNGYKIDLAEVSFVNAVKSQNDSDKLYTLLKDSKKINNLVKDNSAAYLAADRSKLTSYADVQKLVDTVNNDKAKENEVKYVVKVAGEGTKVQFTNALATLSLERVNSAWIESYQTAVAGVTELKVSKVQETIDAVNHQLLTAEINKIDTIEVAKRQDAISKTIDLVNKYMIPDTKDSKVKATMINDLNVKSAVLRLNQADTLASLKAALNNLSKVTNDKATFSYENDVNENLMKAFYDGNVRTATSAKDAQNKIKEIEKVEVTKAIALVKTNATAAKNVNASKESTDAQKATAKDNLLKAFTNLQTVSAKAEKKFDATKVKAELWDLYAIEFDKATLADVTAVQALVNTTNDGIVKAILSDATEETLLGKLKDSRLGLTTVVDANVKQYVAELDTFKTITTLDGLKTQVDIVNGLANVLNSTDVTVVKNELTKVALKANLTSYVNLKDAQKSDVAELLIEDITALKKENKTMTVAELKTAVGTTLITEQSKTVSAVNTADTTTKLVDALNAISKEFKALDAVAKVQTAEAFDNARKVTVNGVTSNKTFTNFTEIRTLVNTVIK